MEFNYLNQLNDISTEGINPADPYQLGTAFFRSGGVGRLVISVVSGFSICAGERRPAS